MQLSLRRLLQLLIFKKHQFKCYYFFPVLLHLGFTYFSNNTLHSRQGYILNPKISFKFSLTFTKIGTFGRAGRRDILFSVVCCNSNRTSVKQCSHSNFFFFFQAPIHLRSSKQHFSYSKKAKQDPFLKAQPGNSIVSLRAVFSFMCQNQHGFQTGHSEQLRRSSFGFYWILQMAFAHRAVRRRSLAACAS